MMQAVGVNEKPDRNHQQWRGKAEKPPVSNEEAWAQNRRADIVYEGESKVKQLPLILLLAGGSLDPCVVWRYFDDTEARQMITDLKKQNQGTGCKSQAQQERLGKWKPAENLRIIRLFNQLEATRDEVKQLRGQRGC